MQKHRVKSPLLLSILQKLTASLQEINVAGKSAHSLSLNCQGFVLIISYHCCWVITNSSKNRPKVGIGSILQYSIFKSAYQTDENKTTVKSTKDQLKHKWHSKKRDNLCFTPIQQQFFLRCSYLALKVQNTRLAGQRIGKQKIIVLFLERVRVYLCFTFLSLLKHDENASSTDKMRKHR